MTEQYIVTAAERSALERLFDAAGDLDRAGISIPVQRTEEPHPHRAVVVTTGSGLTPMVPSYGPVAATALPRRPLWGARLCYAALAVGSPSGAWLAWTQGTVAPYAVFAAAVAALLVGLGRVQVENGFEQ